MSGSSAPAEAIAQRLAGIQQRIAHAAARAGRKPGDVRLVAISKTFSADDIRAAWAAGQRSFGENRVQEAQSKIDQLADLPIEWHLVGHLQSNKARKAATAFAWIQSVDRVDLVSKLDGAARDANVRPHVLIEVDLAHEATKSGARREAVPDVARAVLDSSALHLCGLMIVPPVPVQPDDSRAWFRRLVAFRDELVASGIPADRLADLSMGMSQDFEVAVEEGATIVRIGSAIFGSRATGTQ